MDLMELGQTVVKANQEGGITALLDDHYAPDAVSVEAMAMPGMDREAKGLDAIKGKHAWWDANMEMHSASAEGPFPHGDDRFAVIYDSDVTEKASGQQMGGREVGIYTVADGKIVREEFFYAVG